MKGRFLRGVSLAVAASLMVSVLAACGGKENAASSSSSVAASSTVQETKSFNETGYPIVNDKITLKVMGVKSPIQGEWSSLFVFEEMEKKTNIHLEFDTPPADAYEEKKNLMFASGQYPDMFFGGNLTAKDEVLYGNQGVLVSLEGLIDQYGENLKKVFAEKSSIKPSITALDGHIYALPYIGDVIWELTTKLWINNEWIANAGQKMPTTVDELYTVLKAFKDTDGNKNGKADEIPLSFDKSTFPHVRAGFLSSFGILNMGLFAMNVDVVNDKVRYYPTTDNYKEYLTFMNKLNKEELIDRESFTQTSQQMAAKGNEHRLGLFSNAAAVSSVGAELQTKYVAMQPLTSSVNNTAMWPKTTGLTRGTFAITKNNKHPEASLRWVDYFYSTEGGIFITDGQEGLSWKWTDDTKSQWERIMPTEGFKSTEEFRGGKISPAAGTMLPSIMTTDWRGKLKAAHVPILVKEVTEKYMPVWKEAYPTTYFTEDEQKKLASLEADLNKYVEQMESNFIIQGITADAWTEYTGTLTKMGIDKVVEVYQTAYDRWKSAK